MKEFEHLVIGYERYIEGLMVGAQEMRKDDFDPLAIRKLISLALRDLILDTLDVNRAMIDYEKGDAHE